MIIFTIIPLFMIMYFAFTSSDGGFTLASFRKIGSYADSFAKSIWIAFLSTVVCLIISYPLGFVMSRMKLKAQTTMTMLLMLPMWMNFLLRIYAWVFLLQDGGPISSFLSLFSINVPLIGNAGAVVLGIVYNFFPFMVLPIYSVMTKIEQSTIQAAQDLGANGFRVFTRVVLPLSVPGVISGITMVFVPAASTFLVSQYLGGVNDKLIGDLIYENYYIDKNLCAMLSLVLMAVMLIFMSLMNKWGDNDMEGMVI